jgi:hypothetical protein
MLRLTYDSVISGTASRDSDYILQGDRFKLF